MTVTETIDRCELIDEINRLELRLIELRAMLPSAVKLFFRFRCSPQRYVWVYALSQEIAERQLHARMNRQYGESWRVASAVVDVYSEPEKAAVDAPDSILKCLSREEALDFLADWKNDRQHRPKKPRRENLPKSQLEIDIEAFEQMLRIEAASR